MDQNKALNILFSIFLMIGVILGLVAVTVYFTARNVVFAAIFGFQSLIWLSIGGIGLGIRKKRKFRNEELLRSGRRIRAKITNVSIDYNYTVNQRHPFRIACQYADDGTKTIYTFRSEPIWFDPSDLLGDREIDVCVDYDNFKHYVVDMQSILNGYEIKNL